MTAYHSVHVACSIIIIYRPIGSRQWLGLSVRFALYIALNLLMLLVARSEGTNINGVFLPDSIPWRLRVSILFTLPLFRPGVRGACTLFNVILCSETFYDALGSSYILTGTRFGGKDLSIEIDSPATWDGQVEPPFSCAKKSFYDCMLRLSLIVRSGFVPNRRTQKVSALSVLLD